VAAEQAHDATSSRTEFEAIWSREHRVVFGFLIRRLRDREAAQDLAAETFAVAWRRFGEVPEIARPWLLAVARNLAANHSRGVRRRDALVVRIESDALAPSVQGAEDGAERISERVAGAFNRLSASDREVLALTIWEELRPREAASVLRISPAVFSVRLHRAKSRLRAELAKTGNNLGTGTGSGGRAATAAQKTIETETR
jgi:RNA polymerase sigma-70 factor (ECF subfamily)